MDENKEFEFKGNKSDAELAEFGFVKCKRCGYVGYYKELPLEPVIRKKDWIISIILLPIGGWGLVNLLITYFQRSVKKREKQCPLCDKVIAINKKR